MGSATRSTFASTPFTKNGRGERLRSGRHWNTIHRMKRRHFLGKTVVGGATLLAAREARGAEARVELLLDEPIGTVSPLLFGHFVEHLGGVVYDGVWVGEGSKVPNVGGLRSALVEALKKLKPGVVRWPGGCFADSYDWRDGIGPRAGRPRRTNFWASPGMPDGPAKYDPNQFGTNEFLRFCRLVGAEPYLAANLRSLTARDLYQWVEYCNSPAGSTSLADARAAGGDPSPFGVRFWGVGNEAWGCGGNLTAEEYATEYRKYTAWVPDYGQRLSFIGSGPNAGDLEWTRGFFRKLVQKGAGQLNGLWGWGLHHYSWNVSRGQTTDWEKGKGSAVDFDVEEWYELLREADKVESLILGHWSVMGELDPTHKVKLIVDEWGSWHKPGSEADPTHLLGQVSTLRDALVAGLSLDTFIRHADKVAMANVAQLVNCLHSLFVAHEDRFFVTPNYHVFDMYAAHQNGQAVPTVWSAPPIHHPRRGQEATFWGLSGSASLHDKKAVLTVVNPHASEARETEILCRGAAVREAQARVLTANDLHAHNSFEDPRRLEPKDVGVATGAGGRLTWRFPAASVTRLLIDLA